MTYTPKDTTVPEGAFDTDRVTLNLPLPRVGQKVFLEVPYDFDPGERIPAGATGVVTLSTPDEIHVTLDETFEQLEEFDNIINFYDTGGGSSGTFCNGFDWPPILEFHRVCRWHGD